MSYLTVDIYMIDEARFWAKVKFGEGCWLWSASTARGGYGQSRVRIGQRAMMMGAHRVAYMIAKGEIPRDMQVDHTCFNRLCVNPSHLRLTTAKQNSEHKAGAQSNSRSGIRGVYRRSGKWQGAVRHNHIQYLTARFDDIADAERAVIAKRNELFTHNDVDRL